MKELDSFIQTPFNDAAAFDLAEWYWDKKEYASALSFYLRVTECSKVDLMIYKSLLKAGLCLEKQGDRTHYVKGMYLHAISVLAKRPEAYFLLSRAYEYKKEWQESYTTAEIGISMCDFVLDELDGVEYPGKWGFLFEKSVVLWHMGRIKESIELSMYLLENIEMPELYETQVRKNIKFIWGTDNWSKPTYYKKGDNIRYKFNGIDKIDINHSQAFQDMFVLMALDGKVEGKYLEIGAYKPYEHSNTYLLEDKFNWKGVSLEINGPLVTWFNGKRKNQCLQRDATKANYLEILDSQNMGTDYDYLQLDCEPARNTFEALLLIPFDKYRFAVITYEHDWYIDVDKTMRDKSRKYLQMMGYKLIVPNISIDKENWFEDWWVHPDLISPKIMELLISKTENNSVKDYIFNYI